MHIMCSGHGAESNTMMNEIYEDAVREVKLMVVAYPEMFNRGITIMQPHKYEIIADAVQVSRYEYITLSVRSSQITSLAREDSP